MAAITKSKKSSIKSITYVYQLVYIRNYNIPVNYLGATRKIKTIHHWTHLHETYYRCV